MLLAMWQRVLWSLTLAFMVGISRLLGGSKQHHVSKLSCTTIEAIQSGPQLNGDSPGRELGSSAGSQASCTATAIGTHLGADVYLVDTATVTAACAPSTPTPASDWWHALTVAAIVPHGIAATRQRYCS